MNTVKRLVRLNKYDEALSLLEAEIPVAQVKAKVSKSSDDLFNLLAQRSLVYFKLRRYNASKNDANELIRLDPQNTSGYLYKAKIYAENGHFKLAIQALRSCLKALPSDSDQRAIIKDSIASIGFKSQYKFSDPIQKLPYEILLMIFTPLIKRPRTAANFSLVSHAWYDHFTAEPRYWTKLRFERAIAARAVLRACQLSEGQPLTLDIHGNIASPTNFLSNLASLGHLTTLCLNTSQFTVADIRQLKLSFPRLQYLKAATNAINLDLAWLLETFHSLKRVSLIEQPGRERAQIDDLKLNSPLQALEIVGCIKTRLSKLLLASLLNQCTLAMLSLDQIDCPAELISNTLQQPSLVSFSLATTPTISTVLKGKIKSPLKSLVLKSVKLELISLERSHSIKYLDLQNCDFDRFSVPGLIQALSCASSVETIVLNANRVVVQNDPETYELMPQLQRLDFTSMPILINGRFIEWIEQAMPNLKQINLNESPIEGRFISRLLRHGVSNISCRGAYGIGSSLMQQIQSTPSIRVVFK